MMSILRFTYLLPLPESVHECRGKRACLFVLCLTKPLQFYPRETGHPGQRTL